MADVEHVLGHSVDPGTAGSIHDLNEIPSDVLDDARALDSYVLRTKLMRHLAIPSLHPALPDFIDDVLAGGVDPGAWRRGGILFPVVPLASLVTMEVQEVLAPLEPQPHERWLQIAPSRGMWEIEEQASGAPGLERPELRYDTVVSPGVCRLFLNGDEELWEIDDVTVATRRWMGSRLAARARPQSGVEQFGEPAALLAALFPAVGGFSKDAMIAARAVLRETEVFGTAEDGVPGFRGPAEWFT